MKICIIGGGNMGSAIAKGLASNGIIEGKNITIVNKSTIREYGFGIQCMIKDYSEAKNADIIILATKPWDIKNLLNSDLNDIGDNKKTVFISVVAKTKLEDLEKYMGRTVPLYVAIPNTAIEVKQSMTFICRKNTTIEQDNIVLKLFSSLGKTQFIDEEKMDIATAIASCGLAYALRYIRANMQAGIQFGLFSSLSKEAVAQTLIGAATLILEKNVHPEEEIDRITTPNGITIKGLNALDKHGFTNAIIQAIIKNME